mmetsp:Transcript_76828/g.212294  ORF Transcript_76828/g.212294 Transcript_76828/m.212294 type:complete len:205 (+) Transcript_76828:139-753(+)
MAPPRDEVGEMKAVFRSADLNKDGSISRKELEGVLRTLGDWSEGELEALFGCVETSGSGRLSYEDFVDWVATAEERGIEELQQEVKAKADQATAAGTDWVAGFRELDLDGDGLLQLEEFQQALTKLGVQVTEREAMVLYNRADWSSEGKLCLREFQEVLAGKVAKPEESVPEPALEDGEAQFERSCKDLSQLTKTATCMIVEDL